jgi:L-asparaginase II
MPTHDLRVEITRGDLVESVHHIAAAVVDSRGTLLATSGNFEQVCWWRSAAKPFQALPLVQDGAADRFEFSEEELALACASHSSEPRHVELVSRLLERLGLSDADLSCGPHPPLSSTVAQTVARGAAVPTPRWSNCSGKHTAMLALAKHHGWPLAGYHLAEHPVQQRILREVAAWTAIASDQIALSVDGCTAVCFGLPLRAMALSYARLGASEESAPRRIVGAMLAHPFLVAGTGRLCTDLMNAAGGSVLAKVGAEGIYCAALPGLGVGLALKAESGDGRAAGLALLECLERVMARLGPSLPVFLRSPELARHGRQTIRNTRGTVTGEIRPAGELRFLVG